METGEEIIFLRKIVEGSTDKSYGIHVAKLAGVPIIINTLHGLDLPIDISYLCYTSDNYFPCINYEPLLMNHLTNEIKNYISDAVGNCFDELTASLERQGHSVEVSGIEGDFDVELRNRKVVIKINKELTLTRADETSKYENFAIEIPSKIYDLATVVQEIVSVESNNRLDNKFALGGWLKSYGLIKKIGITRAETSDYSEVYSVEDEITKEKFYFAIRSKVLSVPGY